METLKRTLVAASSIAVLVAALTLIQPKTILGEAPKEMKVVNTSAEPIPTNVLGTVAVSGAVSGTVQAQQSGPWSVGINNSPLVGIDPTRNTVQLAANSGGTKLLLNQDFNNVSGGFFVPAIDISRHAKIRLAGTVNGNGDITYYVFSGPIVGGPHTGLRSLDKFTTDSSFTKTYDVAGLALHIEIYPSDESNNQSILTVYGN
jgi:hypothetical protein